MWMHNGGLGGWKQIKRPLGQRLADKWYLGVHGGTDSEWAFALYLDTLERMGYNPSSPPKTGFGPGVLRQAIILKSELFMIIFFHGSIPKILSKISVANREITTAKNIVIIFLDRPTLINC